MKQPYFKDALTLCKSIMRNGYDAHIVNAHLQHELITQTGLIEVDIATDAPPDELGKIISSLQPGDYPGVMAVLEENGAQYRFYRMIISEAADPHEALIRLTPTILRRMSQVGDLPHSLISAMSSIASKPLDNVYEGFCEITDSIRLEGLPDETLRRDYRLGIRALRLSANFDLPIEPNTWIAIVRSVQDILGYVPVRELMDEWRMVDAENMWKFVRLMIDSQIMHGIIPELTALSCVTQIKNDTGTEETVLDHTLASVKRYPEGELPYDWLGAFAMLFHDIGKLDTAEFFQGRWTFYEHHRIGAKITRKILRRLHMASDEITLICSLVLNHMRFQFMMTDRGLRRFTAEGNTRRLIEMARANVSAREDNFTAFNHNNKYLERVDTPMQMLEPLLNGNEIMEVTGLSPGPNVGLIREELLNAQKNEVVTSREEALNFVKHRANAM